MSELILTLKDEAATVALGEAFGKILSDGGVVYLEGDLGAGKTTLCRGVLQALGHSGAVKSPTYTLVEPYQLKGKNVYHFDLYRLGDPEELEYVGIRDYFLPGNLCLIEWPNRGEGILPAADITVKVAVDAPGRRADIYGHTSRGQSLIKQLAS